MGKIAHLFFPLKHGDHTVKQPMERIAGKIAETHRIGHKLGKFGMAKNSQNPAAISSRLTEATGRSFSLTIDLPNWPVRTRARATAMEHPLRIHD